MNQRTHDEYAKLDAVPEEIKVEFGPAEVTVSRGESEITFTPDETLSLLVQLAPKLPLTKAVQLNAALASKIASMIR